MNQPLRIFLRLVGLVLFVGGVVAIVAFVAVGPERVGELMGSTCHRSSNSHDTKTVCSWRQALGILKDLPLAVFLGALLLALLRPERGERRSARGPAAVGAAVLIVTVVLSAIGTQVYAQGWLAARNVGIGKLLVSEGKRFEVERPRVAPSAPAVGPQGAKRGSLLRPAAFDAALAELRALAPAGARISTLRVAPERIDAQVVAGTRVLALRKQGRDRARVVSTSTVASSDDRRLVAFPRVDVHAPRRITAAARTSGSPARLDYAVLLDAGYPRWNAFFRDGSQVRATFDGRRVQSLG